MQFLILIDVDEDFFDKEVQFDVMLSDIYKIIGEGLREILE